MEEMIWYDYDCDDHDDQVDSQHHDESRMMTMMMMMMVTMMMRKFGIEGTSNAATALPGLCQCCL